MTLNKIINLFSKKDSLEKCRILEIMFKNTCFRGRKMQNSIDVGNYSRKKFNYSLFISLMLLNFIPTIYETVKVFFVNSTATSLDVVSQMEWFDLIDEVLKSSLTIPLYFLLNYIKEIESLLSN